MSGSGCGSRSDDLPRVEFSGSVVRTGDSVDSGSVSVQPIDGHNGPATNGVIDDGEFTIPEAEGPTPGPHKVIIQFMPPKDELMRMQDAGQEPQTAWEFTVVIPEGGSYHHEFKLEEQSLAVQSIPSETADLTRPQ